MAMRRLRHTSVARILCQHPAHTDTDALIDGFQSPLGMEVLATVDWLISREQAEATLNGIRMKLKCWPAGPAAAERKQRLFRDSLIEASLSRLQDLTNAQMNESA